MSFFGKIMDESGVKDTPTIVKQTKEDKKLPLQKQPTVPRKFIIRGESMISNEQGGAKILRQLTTSLLRRKALDRSEEVMS